MSGNFNTGCRCHFTTGCTCDNIKTEVCHLVDDEFTCTFQAASFSGYNNWPMLFFVDESYQKCADLKTCYQCAKN